MATRPVGLSEYRALVDDLADALRGRGTATVEDAARELAAVRCPGGPRYDRQRARLLLQSAKVERQVMGDPRDRLRCLTPPEPEIRLRSRDFFTRHPEQSAGFTSPQPFLGRIQSMPAPLPTQFPFDAVQTLAAFLRSPSSAQAADVANAAYELLGFGLHLWTEGGAQPQPQAQHAPGAAGDPQQQAQQLEQFAQQAQQPQQGQQGAAAAPGAARFTLPPWLIPLALEVLQKVLSGQLTGQSAQP